MAHRIRSSHWAIYRANRDTNLRSAAGEWGYTLLFFSVLDLDPFRCQTNREERPQPREGQPWGLVLAGSRLPVQAGQNTWPAAELFLGLGCDILYCCFYC